MTTTTWSEGLAHVGRAIYVVEPILKWWLGWDSRSTYGWCSYRVGQCHPLGRRQWESTVLHMDCVLNKIDQPFWISHRCRRSLPRVMGAEIDQDSGRLYTKSSRNFSWGWLGWLQRRPSRSTSLDSCPISMNRLGYMWEGSERRQLWWPNASRSIVVNRAASQKCNGSRKRKFFKCIRRVQWLKLRANPRERHPSLM